MLLISVVGKLELVVPVIYVGSLSRVLTFWTDSMSIDSAFTHARVSSPGSNFRLLSSPEFNFGLLSSPEFNFGLLSCQGIDPRVFVFGLLSCQGIDAE